MIKPTQTINLSNPKKRKIGRVVNKSVKSGIGGRMPKRKPKTMKMNPNPTNIIFPIPITLLS